MDSGLENRHHQREITSMSYWDGGSIFTRVQGVGIMQALDRRLDYSDDGVAGQALGGQIVVFCTSEKHSVSKERTYRRRQRVATTSGIVAAAFSMQNLMVILKHVSSDAIDLLLIANWKLISDTRCARNGTM